MKGNLHVPAEEMTACCLPEDDLVEYSVEVQATELVEHLVGSEGEGSRVLPVQEAQVSDALIQHLQGMDVFIVKAAITMLGGRGRGRRRVVSSGYGA